MKVTDTTWRTAMNNLNARPRSNDAKKNPGQTYLDWITETGYGNSILDAGCGYQWLRDLLPEGVEYFGLDPFPVVDNTIPSTIEDAPDMSVDTVLCFAVLDGCKDFYKACAAMHRIAKRNIVIVTGIGFEVDQFHTMKLSWTHFHRAFEGMILTKREIKPNVWLLNYECK